MSGPVPMPFGRDEDVRTTSAWREPEGRRWLSQPSRKPLDRNAVVCLPRPQDGPAPFRRWPSTVNAPADAGTVRLYQARYPGDQDPFWWREHPTIKQQAQDLAAELCDRSAIHITLFGHGMSAFVVYEAAAELIRINAQTLGRLIVSACPSPNRAGLDGRRSSDDEILERALIMYLESGINPLPTQVALMAQSLYAHAEALRSYRPEKPAVVDAPIWALRWRRDGAADRDDETADREAMADWADCGPTRFLEIGGPPARFTQAPTELMQILAGACPEEESFA